MKLSKGTKLFILGAVLVIIDQIIKVIVKTEMGLGETIDVIGDWFKLHFVLNKGMAFGMAFGGLVGKVLLSLFRIVLFGGLCWWINKLAKRQDTPVGVLVGLTLITAGALGNIIDCLFYGIIWQEPLLNVATGYTESMTLDGAPFAFMFGKVVDMFHIPYRMPWMDQPGVLFGGIFNFADACVSCGAVYLLFFQYKFFASEDEKVKK
jgi:signal peptidase II